MELSLNIYTTRLCREVERTVKAKDFELSTGVCEDILQAINIDMFQGGWSALSAESQQELAIELIKNGYPVFKELVQEIFEISDDEMKRVKISDIAGLIMKIVAYSINQLSSSLGKSKKN